MDVDKREEMLAIEDTVLKDIGGVLEAMETVIEYETFDVSRDGKKLFSFRVRGLSDEESDRCREQSTKMVKNRRLGGLKMPGEFNSTKFNSLLIYAATHPDDRIKLWDNKSLWEKAGGIIAPWQLVNKVLKSGEKESVIELIEKLSGYDEGREGLEDNLKNS